MPPSVAEAWRALFALRPAAAGGDIGRLFAEDANRFDRFSFRLGDLFVDGSKNLISAAACERLLDLARAADLQSHRDAMFAGEIVNPSEQRPALHATLRAPDALKAFAAGQGAAQDDPHPSAGGDPRRTLRRMIAFSDALRNGAVRGCDGRPIADIVALGIGGSALGPQAALAALAHDCDGPAIHYASNLDSAVLHDRLPGLDPATTLIAVASKSFMTLETIVNARRLRDWATRRLGPEAIEKHFVALTAAPAEALRFGIPSSRIFTFDEAIGGRFSVWSATGLPLLLAVGAASFRAFLEGAQAMDRHFQDAPLAANIPVILGLIGIWNRNLLGLPTHALIPYDDRLAPIVAWLQQLDMESNGKSVDRRGVPLSVPTGPVIWGHPGSAAQHSFFQHLHQGAPAASCDFWLAARSRNADPDAHLLLAANCLGQSAALMHGGAHDDPARRCPGGRPSTTLLYRRLDPHTLGMLMALYEHKIFVQACIWGVNPFDQWGVELGKTTARSPAPLTADPRRAAAAEDLDPSTAGLLRVFHAMRGDAMRGDEDPQPPDPPPSKRAARNA